MAGSRPKSGPTMHDVAAAAGVSQATVSLVLNSASGSRFSEETRKRVRDAVNRLGYRTNAHAKVLREGVAGMIGFIGDSVATSPFAGAIIEGAQQRAWEDGLLLPHPRMWTRRFVLAPLHELAPHLRDPVSGSTVAEALASLPAAPTARSLGPLYNPPLS